MQRNICFGGSFNPIHLGHLICARAAAETLGLEKVKFFPAGMPAHKPGAEDLAPATDRAEMCRLATAGSRMFEVDDRECRRTGVTYTIDTVRQLRREGWDEVVWLIGGDMLNSLPTWREPDALLREVRFAIMARPGTVLAWEALPRAYQKLKRQVVEVPQIDISATEIRKRVASGRGIEFFCPEPVCRYIESRRLYGKFEGRNSDDESKSKLE